MIEKIKRTINRREVRKSWQGLTKAYRVNVNETERLMSLIGGAGLVVYGLTRFSLSGLGWACAGGYLIYRGLSGHCPVYEVAHFTTASRTERLQFRSDNPAHHRLYRENQIKPAIDDDDVVDERVLESFPASDPPAWYASWG